MNARFPEDHAPREAGPPIQTRAQTPASAVAGWGAWEVSPRFSPLAGYLIRRIVLLALLCMALVLAAQTWSLLRQHEKRFAGQVDNIARTSLPQLAGALWDIELAPLQRQVQAIADLPEVGYVHLRAATGQVFAAGDPGAREASAAVVRRMDILPLPGQGGSHLSLGQLEIVGNPDYVMGEVRAAALQVLLGYGVFTALVCLLVMELLRRRLQKPLEAMARFAADLTPDRLMTPPPRLRQASRRDADEIDLLADGFAKLQSGLREHIDGLDEKVARRTRELQSLVDEVYRLSRTDALTGCWNRRAIEERLPGEVERVQRYGRPLSVLFVSIDHFRDIRHALGTVIADDVLRAVARICRTGLRNEIDWLARDDGEKFLIVLPETDLSEALRVAERLRLGVAMEEKIHEGPSGPSAKPLRLTASVGVVQYRADERAQNLLARANEGVVQAVSGGGNRLVSA